MLEELVDLGTRFGTLFLVGAVVFARLSVLRSPPGSPPRARFRFAFFLFVLHLVALVAAAAVASIKGKLHTETYVGAGLTATIAAVALGSVVLFEGIVRRIRPAIPRIVPDVLTTLAVFIAVIRAASHLGVELTGVIATSAVLTAVIGLSLQDTLGNILGGLALQLDESIGVGDWVKIGDVTGKVVEIRWRYTALETRNWETVILPNSIVTRAQVIVLGRRTNQPVQWRRWVYFQVDFRRAPNEVIDVVERALRAQPIPNVAAAPQPNCIAVDFGESSTKYAVRYWLTDLAVDDPTDSLVRTRIHYALARSNWMLAIPAQTVFVTEDDEERSASKRAEEMSRRIAAIRRIDLFRDLTEADCEFLAKDLQHAPFVRGETLTREGADANHLYMILHGSISVRVGGIDPAHEVARLEDGEVFGEMALLTGEKRRATTVALTDVDCYKLTDDAFRALLQRKNELAERVAKVIVEREHGLVAMREKVDAEARDADRHRSETELVKKIRGFFRLD